MSDQRLTAEELLKLLEYFSPTELKDLLEASHSAPRERPQLHRDPTTGLWLDPSLSTPLAPNPPSPPPGGAPNPSGGGVGGPNPSAQSHRFEPLQISSDVWMERRFYVPDRLDPVTLQPTAETGPIVLMEWQRVVLRYLLWTHRPLERFYHNLILSTLKKTGKSAIAAAIGRYVAEVFGNYSEVVCLGADKEQAEDKLYAAITKSIELSPAYDANLQTLFDISVHPDDPDPDHPTLFMPDYAAPLWRLRSDGAQHIPNHGMVKAVPRVYKKLAGGNQTAAIFTEMWTWNTKDARRLVDEMTPPPTRPRSIRLFEGYAGYEGESGIWEELWDQAMNPKLGGRMVTRAELLPFGGWPFPPAPYSFQDSEYPEWRDHEDPIPLYVNDSLSIAALIDQGEVARRMPWQTPAYYESQKLDESYDRHHRNVKSAHQDEFVPKHWWDACHIKNHPGYTKRKGAPGTRYAGQALPAVPESLRTIPPLDPSEPCVLVVDGSTVDDCTVLLVISYATWWDYRDPEPDPDPTKPPPARRRLVNDAHTMVRAVHIWEPTRAHPMNFTTMLKPEILRYYGYRLDPAQGEDSDQYLQDPALPEMDVKETVYDNYQLHDLMINLRDDYGIWIKSFSQQTGRDVSDKDLYTAIRDRSFWHDGNPILDEHRAGAAKRRPKSVEASTESRVHIVKKSARAKIDGLVCCSMGRSEMAKLNP